MKSASLISNITKTSYFYVQNEDTPKAQEQKQLVFSIKWARPIYSLVKNLVFLRAKLAHVICDLACFGLLSSLGGHKTLYFIVFSGFWGRKTSYFIMYVRAKPRIL